MILQLEGLAGAIDRAGDALHDLLAEREELIRWLARAEGALRAQLKPSPTLVDDHDAEDVLCELGKLRCRVWGGR